MTTSGKSQQGEGSGGRGLADDSRGEQAWTQTTLYPPEVVSATLRVAWIAETGHLQWQIEVSDPLTSELLAMQSVPHRQADSAQHAITQALTGLRIAWDDVMDPDPF